MLFSWLSDKTKHRGAFIVIQALICVVGVVLMAFAKSNSVRYLGTHAALSQNTLALMNLDEILAWFQELSSQVLEMPVP